MLTARLVTVLHTETHWFKCAGHINMYAHTSCLPRCSIFRYFPSVSLSYTHTHALQTKRCGWTWAVFPDVIKCGFSGATLPHFILLQLLPRPSPVITTYQSLGATSAPTKKAPGTCVRGQLALPTSIKAAQKLAWYQYSFLWAQLHYMDWEC